MGTMYLVGGPGNPDDLWAPVKEVKGIYTLKPGTTIKDVDNLTHGLGGRAAMPQGAVAITHADRSVTLIPGLGVTEAAEIQDLAYGVLEKRAKQDRTAWLDEWRERNGLVPREQFGAAISNAMLDRVEQHKRNPVTDPARTPGYTGKRIY